MLRIEVNHKTRTVISLDPDLLKRYIDTLGMERFCEEFNLTLKTTNKTALELEGAKVFKINRHQVGKDSSSGL